MKVQSNAQTLRLRIDESELAQLLDGHTLDNATTWPDGHASHQRLMLADSDGWERTEHGWRMHLDASAVRDLAARLPSRDGLQVTLPLADGGTLAVRFDVDVRDSTRRRYPNKHA